jgi:hypothetical protein
VFETGESVLEFVRQAIGVLEQLVGLENQRGPHVETKAVAFHGQVETEHVR